MTDSELRLQDMTNDELCEYYYEQFKPEPLMPRWYAKMAEVYGRIEDTEGEGA